MEHMLSQLRHLFAKTSNNTLLHVSPCISYVCKQWSHFISRRKQVSQTHFNLKCILHTNIFITKRLQTWYKINTRIILDKCYLLIAGMVLEIHRYNITFKPRMNHYGFYNIKYWMIITSYLQNKFKARRFLALSVQHNTFAEH